MINSTAVNPICDRDRNLLHLRNLCDPLSPHFNHFRPLSTSFRSRSTHVRQIAPNFRPISMIFHQVSPDFNRLRPMLDIFSTNVRQTATNFLRFLIDHFLANFPAMLKPTDYYPQKGRGHQGTPGCAFQVSASISISL